MIDAISLCVLGFSGMVSCKFGTSCHKTLIFLQARDDELAGEWNGQQE